MKKSLLTLIGLFMGFVYTLNAQQIIHFYDESTWQPIAGVHVSVNNQILVSDQQGNISVNEFDELNRNKNKQIRIFNVRKEATEFVYSATDTTKIYD